MVSFAPGGAVYIRGNETDEETVSDDIEIELKDGTSVKLKSRKYGGFNRRSSRPGVKACLTTRGKSSEPAGLDIHGQPYSPDVESTFDVYKTFEIEFESSPSMSYPHCLQSRMSHWRL